MRALVCVVLMGCGVAAGSSSDVAPPPPPVDLQVASLQPGTTTTLTLTGAQPDEWVAFAGSATGVGPGPCLYATGPCLNLERPVLLGYARANAQGAATLSIAVPGLYDQVWVQAAVWRQRQTAKSPVRTGFAVRSVAELARGDLVITEVLKDPVAVGDGVGEWFEVYNSRAAYIDVAGLTVRDRGSDSDQVGASTLLAPRSFAVFGREANPAINGGVTPAVVLPDMLLSNADDELVLEANGVVIDEIAWDNGSQWPDLNGISFAVDPMFATASANDEGAAWCAATEPFGAGDLGTPGLPNPPCAGLVDTDVPDTDPTDVPDTDPTDVPDTDPTDVPDTDPTDPTDTTDTDPVVCPSGSDRDGDGVRSCTDCDDTNPLSYPGAVEICDGRDNDCDGVVPPGEADTDGDHLPDCDACSEVGFRQGVQGASDPAALRAALAGLTSAQTCDDYPVARRFMFLMMDWNGGLVEGVYTGVQVPVGMALPNASTMNTEHTWPQSQGAGTVPAQCDLHHLFPADSMANSRRGSMPFGNVTGGVTWQQGGSRLGTNASGTTVFEPRTSHRGNVARAMLYFSVRYGFALSPTYQALLQSWHVEDPVDLTEIERTRIIEHLQGASNPFVLCPDLVSQL